MKANHRLNDDTGDWIGTTRTDETGVERPRSEMVLEISQDFAPI